MDHLTEEERIDIATNVSSLAQVVVSPILHVEHANGSCSCCVGASVSIGLLNAAVAYAAVVLEESAELHELSVEILVKTFRTALLDQIAERQAARRGEMVN